MVLHGDVVSLAEVFQVLAGEGGIRFERPCIGCSKRFWEKRLEEHLHVSALTGKPLSGLQIFAPMMHVRFDGDCPARKISREDFTIIGREKNNYLLQLKESILITRQRPALNANIASVPLSLMGP